MRNRFWTIILLVAWIGQMPVGSFQARADMCGRATGTEGHSGVSCPMPRRSGSTVVRCWAVGVGIRDLIALIVYQAQRPSPRLWLIRSRRRCGKAGRRKGSSRCFSQVEKDDSGHSQPSRTRGKSNSEDESVYDPLRWGLSPDLSRELPERLRQTWERYRDCFQTQTHNTGTYAYHYVSALLRMEAKRNYTNIGRATGQAPENIQHFMSNSPWSAQSVGEQVQEEIKATPGLERGGVLILDESADAKAGDESAGAGRQRNGRLGKVDMSQVGVLLAYVNLIHAHRPVWTWVDGELFLQEFWFSPEMAERREKVGIPDQREFASKVELGWEMIQRVQAKGLPFEAVACDDLYGRSKWFRDALAGAGIVYYGRCPS